ncbi:uncharacterized protein KY384_008466 [Bacidia gigantensis]|uniref:uncharacterized protein n=1 Tax=Bacidia gigantensis TaxID=2732470 RepID=UPI001D036D7D|nr:uncharacterized protein KY384_008466 [Bacidia gigantensis]KAG8527037.1 hypothetical protein KY384_008466 [Bacidia gigantensis]
MLSCQQTLLALLISISNAFAQSSTSVYSESGVPTGTPITGDYTGALRPQIHYSPPKEFMNDPNGMFVDADDNPTDTIAGNQHWGHTTSKDLYSWDNQPIAIFPDTPGDGIFSGSAVIDVNNTSGFFPNQSNGVVAMYTYYTTEEQTQQIAYSKDGGYTFTKYSGNPVISIGSKQFRDPKVLWHAPSNKWIAVIAYSQEFVVGIYSSPNLLNWTHASNFSQAGLEGLQYECPNLIAVPMLKNASIPEPFESSNIARDLQMYVLAISINPGAPLGGSITEYFPGTFNGTHFTAVDGATRLTDFAKDNYAGQFFYNIPETSPQISIAWASNWQYAQQVPTGDLENFRSIMSLPRRQVLANTTRESFTLLSYPYDLSSLHTTPGPLTDSDKLINTSILYDYSSNVPSGALAFSVNITNIPNVNATGTANFTFLSSVTGESIRGGFFLGGDTPFWLNRGYIHGYDNPFLTDKFSTNSLIDPDTQTFRLFGVIDRSILEVFLNNGADTATVTFFPERELDTVVLGTNDLSEGVGVSAEVWGLKSTWEKNGTAVETAGQRVRRDNLGHLRGGISGGIGGSTIKHVKSTRLAVEFDINLYLRASLLHADKTSPFVGTKFLGIASV